VLSIPLESKTIHIVIKQKREFQRKL